MSKEQIKALAQFYRAFISKQDFEEAKECLSKYQQSINPYEFNVINRALLGSAIISYSRPFTKNNRGKHGPSTPTLMIKGLNKILNNNEIELHSRIIQLRNSFIAHSDYDKKAVKVVQADCHGFVTQSALYDIQSEMINKEDIFMSVIDKMITHCDNIMSKLKHIVGD